MFRLDDTLRVYLHRPAIDFRTGINGLAILVEQALGMDLKLTPFHGHFIVPQEGVRDAQTAYL